MPTITEIEREDSGVSSTEVTPEGQVEDKTAVMTDAETSDTAKEVLATEENVQTTEAVKHEENDTPNTSSLNNGSASTIEDKTTNVTTDDSSDKAKEATTAAENLVDEVLTTAAVKMEEEKKKKKECDTISTLTSALNNGKATLQEEDDNEDDDDDIDETFLERVMGLSEMFPDSLRSITSGILSGSISAAKAGYSFTRQAVWVAVSSSVILFAPVMFEVERLKVDEMMKQDRNRLVLGPGSAMSGPPGAGGLAPPPPAR